MRCRLFRMVTWVKYLPYADKVRRGWERRRYKVGVICIEVYKKKLGPT